ncbi:MAG: hydroxyphenylacetyl-CoA thioesterase PaaI [Gammaproteobacteria bacterium]|nr:hydroxyphenylacetyl-CoA thioesterase PaaI [Gammaproteobacteria bacterium]
MFQDMDQPTVNPQILAERAREALWREDFASQALGMVVSEIAPGQATLTMTVRRDMLNGFGICHGGLLMTFADTAMAFASNSYNEAAVAINLSADFLASSYLGDCLTAKACERARTKRTGLYDVTVTNQRGETLTLLRGRVHRTPGKFLSE